MNTGCGVNSTESNNETDQLKKFCKNSTWQKFDCPQSAKNKYSISFLMQWTPNSGHEFALIFPSDRIGKRPRMYYASMMQAYRKRSWTGNHSKDMDTNTDKLDHRVSTSHEQVNHVRINQEEATTHANHGHNLESYNLDNRVPEITSRKDNNQERTDNRTRA